jgi:Ca2+-binding EF-hand superfamily protein
MDTSMADAGEMFEQWDLNGDGELSRDELVVRINEDEVDEILADFGLKQRVTKAQFGLLWRYLSGDNNARIEAQAQRKFREMDDNGDGKLSLAELEAWMGEGPEGAQRILAMVDADGDKHVDEAEFYNLYRAWVVGDEAAEREMQHRYYERIFKAADADGDGLLTAPELVSASKALLGEPLSLEEVESMISNVDADNDGKITLQEFLTAM